MFQGLKRLGLVSPEFEGAYLTGLGGVFEGWFMPRWRNKASVFVGSKCFDGLDCSGGAIFGVQALVCTISILRVPERMAIQEPANPA